MMKIALVSIVGTLALMLALLSPVAVQSADASTHIFKKSTTSTYQEALDSVRGFLISNASVNVHRPASFDAPMQYVANPSAITQEALDSFNRRNEVDTHLIHLSIDKSAVWHDNRSFIFYGQMVYNAYNGKTKKTLYGIRWNYLFVTSEQADHHFRVTSIIAPVAIRNHASSGRFDYAPSVRYAAISSVFKQHLDAFAQNLKYPSGRLHIAVYGYYYDMHRRMLQVYLLLHNGATVPAYDLTGRLQAELHGNHLFTASYSLTDQAFGILFPNQTRFTILTVPATDIQNRKELQKYSSDTAFTNTFSYEPL